MSGGVGDVGSGGECVCITLHVMSCRGIDQKRNNIGLLRVGMPFCRHVPTVRW